MVDTAAHLVDHVLPDIPIRQWVLSFPWPLRMLYSANPSALTRTLQIVLRAIETHMIRKAGLTRAQGARGGAITFIQHFGSAIKLNMHLHMLIADGIYTFEQDKPRFHRVNAPTKNELEALLSRVIARITRHLQRDGLLVVDEPQPYLDLERLSVTDEGKLRYALKHPYSNGTTHLLFEPLDFIARLAALVPKPRINLIRYHGMFAPNSKLRRRVEPAKNSPQPGAADHCG